MEPKMIILFIGKKSRITRHQLLPIYLRVTIEGKRFEVATHRHVEPFEWLPSGGKVRGRSESAVETNMALDMLRKQVYDYKDRIIFENRNFTVDTLRQKWFGEHRSKRTLLGVFRLSIQDLEKLVAKGKYCRSTLVKYKTTEKHITEYLQWQNNGCDIVLLDLRIDFARNFEFYLQAEKSLSINSSGKMIKNLKKVIIISDCVDRDWLDKDPFYRFKVRHTDPQVPHLSAEQLKILEEKDITINRLSIVRDMFVFSCYTGFAYIDVVNLTTDHIKVGIDGKKWLIKLRQKTGISERVPILPPAFLIIKKYEDHSKFSNAKKLFPLPSNQKVNAYLKELADICSINIQLTFHMARHTFASTVTLENGVPIDSVSKMLGHKSIKTTQIYAKVSDKKISCDTKRLFKTFRCI
ncbi:MAG: site-specific integrase [Chitinophagaceae bacterium]